ncbi:hypothetical protein BDZ45DRAFT_724364 [Acephala macrosclerotiorum]|nr:hypothetical protein BDZ45DRAFT_724364 [Acephala macrosclerotiorum]
MTSYQASSTSEIVSQDQSQRQITDYCKVLPTMTPKMELPKPSKYPIPDYLNKFLSAGNAVLNEEEKVMTEATHIEESVSEGGRSDLESLAAPRRKKLRSNVKQISDTMHANTDDAEQQQSPIVNSEANDHSNFFIVDLEIWDSDQSFSEFSTLDAGPVAYIEGCACVFCFQKRRDARR